MPLGKLILIGFLALPLIEIGVFVAAASAVGALKAFIALLATSALGLLLLLRAGRQLAERAARILAEQDAAGLRIDNAGLFAAIAGLLLFIPGFVTDAIGLLLFLPFVRRAIASAFPIGAGSRDDGVVDLAEDEWRRVPQRRLAGDGARGKPDPAAPDRDRS